MALCLQINRFGLRFIEAHCGIDISSLNFWDNLKLDGFRIAKRLPILFQSGQMGGILRAGFIAGRCFKGYCLVTHSSSVGLHKQNVSWF